jgi:hypothetical protein
LDLLCRSLPAEHVGNDHGGEGFRAEEVLAMSTNRQTSESPVRQVGYLVLLALGGIAAMLAGLGLLNVMLDSLWQVTHP